MAVGAKARIEGETEIDQEASQRRVDTPLRRTVRRFRRHRLAMGGLVVILILALMGVFAPLISPVDPIKTDLPAALTPPSRTHWLGTDMVGRDVWSRVVYGIRISLSVGLVSVGVSIAISLVLGTASGYYGGWVDMVIMRLTDIVMCFPSLIIIMTVVALVGPSIYNIMIVIGVLGWTGLARLVRGQILSAREWEYVTAARCLGARNSRIMIVHVLPNVIAPLVVAATFGVAGAILAEASLSFLGYGVMPPTPSWGSMLNAARSLDMLRNVPWFWVPPGVMILVTVLAINFIGDALDPRMTLR